MRKTSYRVAFVHLPSVALLVCLALSGTKALAGQKQTAFPPLAGTVADALRRPVPGVVVTLQSGDGRTVASAITDDHGQFRLPEPTAGSYALVTRRKGFKPTTMIIILPKSARKHLELVLESERALTLPVSANRINPQNGLSPAGANKYTLTAEDITNLPEGEATPLNQVMLQMPGVALDQNQEIHIRGEHMGIQYQMNGIMLPLDVNTDPTFIQLLNAYFVKSVALMDGVLPAQYGYRTSGIIDIHTKDGCDAGRNELMVSGGQRDTAQATFQLAGCGGDFSYYLTGLFLQSNLGFNSAVPAPDPIHDAVTQGQGFAYLTYALSPTTKLSLISGMTLAFNQYPNQPDQPPLYQLDHINPASYPSSGINSGLNQQDYYGVLALNGALGSKADYQLAYTAHYNTQSFYPDSIGDLIYQGISSNVFTSDLSNTLQGDLTWRLGASNTLRGGFYMGEYGVESDQTSQVFPIAMGHPATTPISLTANLNKINLVYGVYLQDDWQITDRLSVNFGSRWDRVSGFTVNSQFSPTINFVYKPRTDTTLHAGFARSFQVPNFQNVSSGIFKLFAGTTGAVGTSPSGNTSPFTETDYTWDTGFTHQFTPHLAYAQDNYFRIDRHYLDEGEFAFVPIDAPFNYVRGYGGGTEHSLTYNLEDFALRANVFVAREEDIGVASGQYNFPADEVSYIDRHYFVLDHTPLVGASGGAAYRWHDYQFAFDGLFSSGLRGGFANQTQLPKVWQFNLSAARGFAVAGLGKFTNRIVLLNIFDRTNLIRPPSGIGVFQAAYGPRITIYDALTIPLPATYSPSHF
ncbi:TonB-dependent receptor [Candidatus Binatus sp.]|uniref:TonB-dependent receptor n=1 Tax=Candidatus Binatus sp. TaxID=2811406 RepID=UPI003BCBEB99